MIDDLFVPFCVPVYYTMVDEPLIISNIAL